ncbi:MAG: DnaA regulatory inactivator Hda [Pseudomonadota bacterium]|jgi:DnaA family protein
MSAVLQSAWAPMRQMALDLGPSDVPGLDDFVVGDNAEVLAWLRAWPDSATPGAPTYLWGGPGLGKTHLLKGLASQALGLGWHVLWLDPQGFQSWDCGLPQAPTLVLMDDCDRLDAQQQHWAFNLFIECAASLVEAPAGSAAAIAIVAAGRVPPVDLPVRDDLRTRLGWGLTFAVHCLAENDLRDALLLEARRRGLKLHEGVLPYLLTHCSRDQGDLMRLLDQLDRFALAEQRGVTVPLLKQMLALETP